MGDGLWWLHSEQTVKRPGLAFVTPEKPIRYLGQPLHGLFCLASLGEAHLEVLGGELPADWPSARIGLANAHGLHARPAKVLAQLAKSFEGDIRVRIVDAPGSAVSVKSLSKLLSLGARRGQVLEFIAEPTIAADALPAFDYPLRGQSAATERQRLQEALGEVRKDIETLIQRSKAKAIREIFITHQEMLDDPELTDEVDSRLKLGESAEAGWMGMAVIEAAARQQESLQDALLAERAADLRDIGRRVLAQLCGVQTLAEPDEPYVLVMDEVGPSDVARLDPSRRYSHRPWRGHCPQCDRGPGPGDSGAGRRGGRGIVAGIGYHAVARCLARSPACGT